MVKYLRENNEIKTIPIECVKGATLLSVDEAENLLTREERDCTYEGQPCWWWLRSPGFGTARTASVLVGGSVDPYGYVSGLGYGYIRPVLIISNLQTANIRIGDVFEFGGYKFKIISNMYALCEEAIGECIFRKDDEAKDANIYESSDVKKFVDNWFNTSVQDIRDVSSGIKTDKMIADENDWGF